MIINMQSGGVVPERIIDAQTITPSTKNKVFEEGTYLRGSLNILGDADLVPENIKNGVNIFGVIGNVPPNYGENAWSRYSKEPGLTSVYSIALADSTQISSENTVNVTLNNSNISLSDLDISSFDKMTITQYYGGSWHTAFTFYGDGTVTYYQSGGTEQACGTFTYDKSTGKITWYSTNQWGSSYTRSGSSKTIIIPYSDLGFIVSEDGSAYPESGYIDGIWYEKIIGGVSLSRLGVTRAAIDKLVLTSATHSINIYHSLGTAPKFAILVASEVVKGTSTSNLYISKAVFLKMNNYSYGGWQTIGMTSNAEWLEPYGQVDSSKTIRCAVNDTIINFTNQSNVKLAPGVEYTLVTMG